MNKNKGKYKGKYSFRNQIYKILRCKILISPWKISSKSIKMMRKWRGTPSVLGRFLTFFTKFPLENLAFWLKISPNLLNSRGMYLLLPLYFPLNLYSYCIFCCIFYCISLEIYISTALFPLILYFYCILPCVFYLFSIEFFLSNYFYLLINLIPNNSIP